MQHIKGYNHKKALAFVAIAAVASGCQAMPRADISRTTYANAYNYAAAPAPAPAAAAPVAAAPAQVEPSYMTASAAPSPYAAPSAQVEATILNLKERLERVEKAMLRLDRRMQLVEKNELSRMSGQTSESNEPEHVGQVAMNDLGIGPSLSEGGLGNAVEGFRAVSSRGNESITSALQAAPRASAFGAEPLEAPTKRTASLPSLADPAPSASRGTPTAPLAQVAIWTVNYSAESTWPDRTQLPASKDVVDTLRQSGGMTLYARGKNANGVQFRERVKAISRYLAKVSSLDTVPIVAMAAPHLDDQTIEIMATH